MLAYTNDSSEQFLNPFRPKWPEAPRGSTPRFTEAVSLSDPTVRWDFWSVCGAAHTDGFSAVWYSYLAEYRGGSRLDEEQISPSDAELLEERRDALSNGVDEKTLYRTTYHYSPPFWQRWELFADHSRLKPCVRPEDIRTASHGMVRHPAAKVLLWERVDSRYKGQPRSWVSANAKVHVSVADGSVDFIDMAALRSQWTHGDNGSILPIVYECPGAVPIPFITTRLGVAGRDLNR